MLDNDEICEQQKFQVGDVVIYRPQGRTATVIKPAYYFFEEPTVPVHWHDINDTGSAFERSLDLVRPVPEIIEQKQETIEI